MNSSESSSFICHICGIKIPITMHNTHPNKHGIKYSDYKLLFGKDLDSYIQCTYFNEDTQHQCKLNKYSNSEDNFCILHHPTNDKDHELFGQILEILIKMWRHDKREFHLEGTYFPIAVSLSNKIIENKAYFTESHFYDKVDFSNAIFMDHTDFEACHFDGESNFQHSEFRGEAHFEQSVFFQETTFRRSKFFKKVSFWRAEFKRNTSFRGTYFSEYLRFVSNKFPQTPFYIILMGAKFEKPKLVLFSGLDLSRVLFRWVDLSEIQFENITWLKSSIIKGERRYLADESYPNKEFGRSEIFPQNQLYDYVQDLYQQLKRNFENRGSYAEAGDFYYGEMECYRKGSWVRRYLPSLVNLYRISSGYGQRYIRAGIVMILMLLFFSCAHLFLGLEPTSHNSDYSKIQYSFNLDFKKVDSFVSDLFISTVYCVEVLIREEEPDRLFKPMSTKGDILNSTFSILVYLQILFFILAVRRHFKR